MFERRTGIYGRGIYIFSVTSTCSCCTRPVSPLSVYRLSACLPAFCPPCPSLASGLPGYLPLKFSIRYLHWPPRPALGLTSPRNLFDETRLTLRIIVHARDSNWSKWFLEILFTAVSNEQPPDKHSRSLLVSEARQTIYIYIYIYTYINVHMYMRIDIGLGRATRQSGVHK